MFAHENWNAPSDTADEYTRVARHHLPRDVIAVPLTKPTSKDWPRRLKERNQFIYYPNC